jgi:hypothetical protein
VIGSIGIAKDVDGNCPGPDLQSSGHVDEVGARLDIVGDGRRSAVMSGNRRSTMAINIDGCIITRHVDYVGPGASIHEDPAVLHDDLGWCSKMSTQRNLARRHPPFFSRIRAEQKLCGVWSDDEGTSDGSMMMEGVRVL